MPSVCCRAWDAEAGLETDHALSVPSGSAHAGRILQQPELPARLGKIFTPCQKIGQRVDKRKRAERSLRGREQTAERCRFRVSQILIGQPPLNLARRGIRQDNLLAALQTIQDRPPLSRRGVKETAPSRPTRSVETNSSDLLNRHRGLSVHFACHTVASSCCPEITQVEPPSPVAGSVNANGALPCCSTNAMTAPSPVSSSMIEFHVHRRSPVP